MRSLTRGGAWAAVTALLLAVCALLTSPGAPRAQTTYVPAPPAAAPATSPSLDDRRVRSTILPGTLTSPPPAARTSGPAAGDVTLNYPQVDVQAVAKAILGDILHQKYTIDPQIHAVVTVQTTRPIARGAVLPLFEEALKAGNLALTVRAGVYAIVPLSMAQGEAGVIGPADTGFGTETVTLKYASAEELKKLLDPIVPGAIAQADTARNVLIVQGTTTQRKSIRALVAQFDVDWLKGMSFALFIPQRTDARLIAPELDKMLNGPGSQTAGMVRLITMEHLNGILAISAQPALLEDVRRFVEVLDREGEGAEKRIFVYHVQNGRAADLGKVLDGAFGIAVKTTGGESNADSTDRTGGIASPFSAAPPGQTGSPLGGTALGGVNYGTQIPPPTGGPQNNKSHQDETSGQSDQTNGEPNGTTITADETNNAIVVFSTPREYALIEDALRKLDVPPLQVYVDAVISEVTLNNNLQYGIQWFFQSQGNSGGFTQGTPVFTPPGTTPTAPSGAPIPLPVYPGFTFLHQSADATVTLNALRAVTDVHVLSAPKLMVLNNHTATIEVGDQVPISTGSEVGVSVPGAPVINSIEYQQTGVILKVTPRVNDNGLVLLDIDQEVSSASTTDTSNISSPTIQQRKIVTSVAVQDGETISLGGLIKNSVTKTSSRVPFLGDIPVIGQLFGSTGHVLDRTELLVLLTPRVVRAPVDADAIVKELKSKIEMAEPPPPPPPPPKPKPARSRNGS
ncbi:MAG: type II secretion system secretin GspD [Caulobacteraceae bacterium]